MNKLLLFFLFAFVVVYTSCDKEKKKLECVLCDEMYYAECGVKDEAYQDDDYHDEEDDEYDDDEKDEYSNWDKYIVEPLVQDPNCLYYTSGTVKFFNKYDEDDHKEYDDEKEHYANVVFFVTYHADGWATKKKMVFEKSCKQKGKEAGEVVFCCKYQQECLTEGAVSKKSLHAKKN